MCSASTRQLLAHCEHLEIETRRGDVTNLLKRLRGTRCCVRYIVFDWDACARTAVVVGDIHLMPGPPLEHLWFGVGNVSYS